MQKVPPILKAFFWLAIGVFFGLGSVPFIYAAAKLFGKPIHGRLIDGNLIMFLSVALMAGAGADFLLSHHWHWGKRGCAFFVCIILFLPLGFVFNPNNASPPLEEWVNNLAIFYSVVGGLYCIGIKTLLFKKESVKLKKA